MKSETAGRILLFALVSFLLTSCATPKVTDLSGEQLARLGSFKVYRESVNRPYRTLGEVKGMACKESVYAATDLISSEAVNEAKIRALLMDADAIIHLTCSETMTNMASSCQAMVVCKGEAIKFSEL